MRIPGWLKRIWDGAVRGVLLLAAAGCAYEPAHALGLRQEFWAPITAILVLQTEMRALRNMARNQALGGIIGGTVALALLLCFGDTLPAYLGAVLLSAVLCHGLNLEGASQIAGVTATILMLVPHTETPAMFLLARLSEVGWGICVGAAVAWLALRRKG